MHKFSVNGRMMVTVVVAERMRDTQDRTNLVWLRSKSIADRSNQKPADTVPPDQRVYTCHLLNSN